VIKGLTDHGVDTGGTINDGTLRNRPVPKLNAPGLYPTEKK
jgi:hypothetical protein